MLLKAAIIDMPMIPHNTLNFSSLINYEESKLKFARAPKNHTKISADIHLAIIALGN
jgi:hypothetical protein